MQWLKGPAGHLLSRLDPIVDAALVKMRTKLGLQTTWCRWLLLRSQVGRVPPASRSGKDRSGVLRSSELCTIARIAGDSGPLAIIAAKTDTILPAEKRHESEEILNQTGQLCQINLYHGFAARFRCSYDPNDKMAKYAKETAFLQVVQWLDEHLKA